MNVGIYSNPQDVELFQSNVWSEPILCVENMFSEDGYTVAIRFSSRMGQLR